MKYRLVLIVAPAGAGKTRLLWKWVWERSKNNPPAPAWVILEQPDNDIEFLLHHLTVAFIAVEPAMENRLAPVKRDHETFNSEDMLIDLINRLAELPQDIILILDEYHRIQSPEVHQAISFFLNYLPRNVHMYLATRDEPPFRIAHLRARREMIELGPAELLNHPE
jgi:LuxR family maltose regulon positive regulatory protein